MRFSAVAGLCVAPLVLAGTLQQDLVARGALDLEIDRRTEGSADKANQNNNKNNNNANNNVVFVESTKSTEVILIWVNEGAGAATQTVTNTVTVTKQAGVAAGTAGAAAAVATHQVVVGGPGGLVYSPEQVTAAVGDMVVFTFMSQNHTVTQSAFTEPCKAIDGAFDSGFIANPNNTISPPPQMGFQVAVDTPIWFYCKQVGHCGKGMTFSINPTANKTQATFKAMAISQNGTGAASPITGGTSSAAAPVSVSTESAAAVAATSTSTDASAATSGAVTPGTGTFVVGGACDCSCLCATGSFPNAVVQGVGAFGGMSGSMPLSSIGQ